MVIKDLDATIHIRVGVECEEIPDGLEREIYGTLCECGIFSDTGSRVEDRSMQPDANLIYGLAKEHTPYHRKKYVGRTWLSLRRVQIWRRSTLYVGVDGDGSW